MFRQQVLTFALIAIMTQASLAIPVGQLSGTLGQFSEYPANTEITDLQADETFQGFSHENGRLKVQEDGSYYIYAQAFFQTHNTTDFHNRVALTVNGADFGLMQTGLGGQADYGTLYTGGVTHLQQGDYISLVTVYDSYLWVSGSHTFLGAYKIIEQGFSCDN